LFLNISARKERRIDVAVKLIDITFLLKIKDNFLAILHKTVKKFRLQHLTLLSFLLLSV